MKTLAEVRKDHQAHTGYIWQCPHCAAAYWRALNAEVAAVTKHPAPLDAADKDAR